MPRRRWVIGLAGGLLSWSLAMSVSVPPSWAARPANTPNRACLKEAVQAAKQHWQSLSAAERQQLIDQSEEKVRAGKRQWQAMTPEQRQRAKEDAAKRGLEAKLKAEKRCQEQSQ